MVGSLGEDFGSRDVLVGGDHEARKGALLKMVRRDEINFCR